MGLGNSMQPEFCLNNSSFFASVYRPAPDVFCEMWELICVKISAAVAQDTDHGTKKQRNRCSVVVGYADIGCKKEHCWLFFSHRGDNHSHYPSKNASVCVRVHVSAYMHVGLGRKKNNKRNERVWPSSFLVSQTSDAPHWTSTWTEELRLALWFPARAYSPGTRSDRCSESLQLMSLYTCWPVRPKHLTRTSLLELGANKDVGTTAQKWPSHIHVPQSCHHSKLSKSNFSPLVSW